jgi:hypothetical protein
MTLRIRPVVAGDLDKAKALLAAAGLPVEDLSSDRLALVSEKEKVFQGVIGTEPFSNARVP